MIRQRLKMEQGGDELDEDGRPAKASKSGVGAWVVYKEVKPGKKLKRGQREPVFYYSTVTRKSEDFVHGPLHLPRKAMFGMHFYTT